MVVVLNALGISSFINIKDDFDYCILLKSSNGNWDDPDDDCEKYYFCIAGVAYPSVNKNIH